MVKKLLPLIIIFLIAFALRTYDLTDLPPGLTHDEANHGRDSMNILDGELLFYFPLNYGSEPLYNYLVAGEMILVGENLLSLRLVNVSAGILLIAAVYLWASWAFNRSTALLAAALIAVSFWPVATSRQALRAGLLPLLITSAAIFFWLILRQSKAFPVKSSNPGSAIRWWAVTGFALSIALTLHTYLAARVIWILFPLFLLYLAFFHRRSFRRSWLPIIFGLAAAALLVVPMFAYVNAHPEADTRLEMLDGPLQNLRSGEFGPLFANAGEALLAFFWPGFGDGFLAYNIPGRPLFTVITAGFFLLGIGICLWRFRRPGYAFLVIWFAVGILPSLITGPTANTTRNIGALPAVYVLPAVGFVTLVDWIPLRWGEEAKKAAIGFGILWITIVGLVTIRDYFIRWGQDPDVRAAYQQTLVKVLDYLNQADSTGPVVISSVYPGAAHDPSIARVLMPTRETDFRWLDVRHGLLFPSGEDGILFEPSSTPLHPAFQEYAIPIDKINLRTDDLDPSVIVYALEKYPRPQADTSINFADSVFLRDARWLSSSTSPGGIAELQTVWEVIDPEKAGPLVPPAFETDVVLFAHVLNNQGEIISQQDRLDVPSWAWQEGDVFIQIHRLSIPLDTAAGQYETLVGIYDRASGDRLPILDFDGQISRTTAVVVPLTVE